MSTSPEFYDYLQNVIVTIQETKGDFMLAKSEMRKYVPADLESVDRSFQQFLEIAIAQPILNDP